MEPRYKTLFAAQIHAIEADESTRNEAKASLSRLRDLLPANINPEDEPALLFAAGNLAVADYVNLNDDGYDTDTALATYKSFVWQQVNLEHDRKNKVGFIVHAGLTELGTDRVITEDEARAAGKPFNIAIVIALWRVGEGRDLCSYIEEASSPTHPDFNALSLSFEVGFDNYRIVALPKDSPRISEAVMTIRSNEAAFGRFDGALRANKGTGLSPDDANLRVYRVIDEGVLPLGAGIVTVPAAAVKGLIAITRKPEEIEVEEEDDEAEEQARVMALALEEAKNTARAFLEHVEKKIALFLKTSKTRVSSITPINSFTMKLTDLQGLKQKIAKASKIEELPEIAAGLDPVIDAIIAESERQEAAKVAAEKQASDIAAAKAQIETQAAQVAKDLEAVRAELAEIKANQAAAAAEEAFNNRMADLETIFDLDDDTRAYFASEIKACDSDESYAKKKDGFMKIMKEKTKEFKKKKMDETKCSQDALLAKLDASKVKASFSEAGELVINEVIASAVTTPVSTPAGTMITPENSGDIKTLASKAMAGVSFGGKKKVAAK